MSAPSYTITNETVTVILDGRTHTVRKSDPKFQDIVDAIMSQAWDDLLSMFVKGVSIEKWLGGDFQYNFDTHSLQYQGEQIPDGLNRRMLAVADEGHSPEPLMRFWEKLQQNPSYRSVNQLWGFMDQQGIPITEDGDILAYKAVRRDYTDCYSGKFSNKPGTENKMPRNKISDDPKVACHEGFHVGALSYAKSFGPDNRRIVICKVNPADVVCVPYDSSQQKMRVCRYVVIGNHGDQMPDTIMPKGDLPKLPKAKTSQASQVPIKPLEPSPGEKDSSRDMAVDPNASWHKLAEADEAGLKEASTADLRKYAAHDLKIVGACKIKGGKDALIARILDVRD